jgi:GNAT superfamily N-acetyltransferase
LMETPEIFHTKAINITIRSACPRDISRMALLLSELFSIEKDFAPDREKQVQGISSLVADQSGRSRVFVAEQAGVVVGMATVQTLISTAEGGCVGLVEDVIVDRDKQRQGIGTRLLDAVAEWSWQRGLRRLQLVADRENLSAIDFYIRRGWNGTQLICLRRQL